MLLLVKINNCQVGPDFVKKYFCDFGAFLVKLYFNSNSGMLIDGVDFSNHKTYLNFGSANVALFQFIEGMYNRRYIHG